MHVQDVYVSLHAASTVKLSGTIGLERTRMGDRRIMVMLGDRRTPGYATTCPPKPAPLEPLGLSEGGSPDVPPAQPVLVAVISK